MNSEEIERREKKMMNIDDKYVYIKRLQRQFEMIEIWKGKVTTGEYSFLSLRLGFRERMKWLLGIEEEEEEEEIEIGNGKKEECGLVWFWWLYSLYDKFSPSYFTLHFSYLFSF